MKKYRAGNYEVVRNINLLDELGLDLAHRVCYESGCHILQSYL